MTYECVKSIMGRVVGMSRDQGGSRTVQQAIEAASHTGTQQVPVNFVPFLPASRQFSMQHGRPLALQSELPPQVQSALAPACCHVVETRLLLRAGVNAPVVRDAAQCSGKCDSAQAMAPRQELTAIPPMQATLILEELQPHALALMTDQFGNYVIQKLLDHGGEDVRAALGKEIQGRVLELTVNTFGCRIVQKALEVSLLQTEVAPGICIYQGPGC